MKADAAYAQALEYIHGVSRFGSRLGLDRTRRLLAALGDPQRGLRVIHVAGTNGKGSVSAMLASILQAAGYRSGLYISPYIVDFRERISIDGRYIEPGDLADLLFAEVRPAAEGLGEEVTEFELITALGFLYYARKKVDWLVCEVGLGGRFDATNVIDRPVLSVITSIGLDHTDRLGTTIAEIAAEKAGIIKRGAPVVTAGPPGQPVAALEVIAAAARRRDCPLHLGVVEAQPAGASRRTRRGMVRPVSSALDGQVLDFSGPGFPDERGLRLPLLGPHQAANAAVALTAAGVLRNAGLSLDATALRHGLAATVWPGRFEVFRVAGTAGRAAPPIIVDGAHNPPGAEVLAASLRSLVPGRRIHLVLGFLADKDADSFLGWLLPPALPEVAGVFTCRPSSPRAMDPVALAGLITARAPGLPVSAEDTVTSALRSALAAAGPEDVICVAGSLYQVGEARRAAAALGRETPVGG